MSRMVFLDSRVFVSGADLSGWSSKIEIGEEFEDKKVTNFRSGKAEEIVGGLAKVDIQAEGQFEEGDPTKPGDSFWASRRVIEPWSVAPDSQSDLAAGNLMYLTCALRTSIKLFDAVGEVSPWSANAKGSAPLVRGMSVHQSGTPRTATGTGTIVDMLVAPAAGQKAYANLHVLSATGTTPSLTVAVQSAAAIGFASPTVRGTFNPFSAVGGQGMAIASPGTDRYWRLSWTISGTTPSFLFLASLGFE